MTQNNMTKRSSHALVWISRIPRWVRVLLAVAIVSALIFLFRDWMWEVLRHRVWDWMRKGVENESYGDTLRNLILILAGPLGLGLALWRSITADRQTKLTQRGLKDERYQKGADMLGSDTLATRIGGLYALEHLAQDHPEEYHIQIMVLLCAFVRQPRRGLNQTTTDIQDALTAICQRGQEQRDLENKENWKLDLFRANLNDTDLKYAHLAGANLQNARLRSANLGDSILVNVNLTGADLNGAYLVNTNLKGSKLEDAGLTGTNLKNVRGLTQEMLDSAKHLDYKGTPLPSPNLEGAFCAESGKPLVWNVPPHTSSTSNDAPPASSSP